MSDVLPFRRASAAAGAPPSLTVSELVGRYLAERELDRRAGLVGDRLCERFARYLGLLADELGTLAAAEVRPSDVTRWILSHPTWQSDHTRQDAARSVLACWRWAEEEELLERNRVRKLKRCWDTPRPRGAIRPEEYRAIMDLAKSCNGQGRRKRPSRGAFRLAVWFLWETGARTCEMRAARWCDLDLERGVLVLDRHKTARVSGQARLIGLPAPVLRLLRWVRRRRAPQPSEPIFLSSRGTPWTKGTFGRLWRKYADLAGVRKEVSAYCLRHGFTVEALSLGVGERQLADALGHSSTRYVAWYGADARARADYLRGVAEQVRGRGRKG